MGNVTQTVRTYMNLKFRHASLFKHFTFHYAVLQNSK